jgi:two-component sensor histidine kinase
MNLDATALKKSEPVATVMQVMDTAQGLGALRTPLFMVLTELFSNALEHGLLGLSSEIKQGPNGFADYYEARQQRLEALEEAELTIDCQHLRDAQGGVLRIRVAHSGLGFDPTSLPVHMDQNVEFKGRGIRLVRSLCESLEYGDEGREAIALYRWSAEGG